MNTAANDGEIIHRIALAHIAKTVIHYEIFRDHKGVGVAHKITSPKTSLNFPSDDKAVLVR